MTFFVLIYTLMNYIKTFESYKNIKLIIANKRFGRETEKSYSFTTSGYSGMFFNIAKSQIISKNDSKIQINDVYSEPATQFVITNFMYSKIKDMLEKMSKHDLIIIEE